MNTEHNNKQLTSLQKAFLAIENLQAKLERCQLSKTEPIAVIGMGCRFPGNADSVDHYWQMLLDGVDAVGPIPEHRWSHSSIFDPSGQKTSTTYVNEGAFIEQVDGFDAEFFAIPPREANYLDPQQRLLLELAYETLQDAGIASSRLTNTQTGVFIGIGQQDYLELLRESDVSDGAGVYTGTGNGFCFASGRLSYQLGLQGPSFSIDTACSSSLLAVHQACLSLRAYECDLALTGGVQLMLSPSAFIFMSDARALAADGRCKSFAAVADGYGRGEGAGMVALKRLSDARRDGDRVLAEIRGSVVDHDGRSSGLTVPNGRAQQQLLTQLLTVSNTRADELGYVEAHGTGTSLGDPVEFNALAEVLRSQSRAPLVLGSVKTNIGHLEAAAGIAGLIKLILMIKNNKIPPSLHFDQPNPAIPWQDYPITVADKNIDWPETAKPRVGLVSSFGLSGTNVQALVAESNEQDVSPPPEGHYVFKLSAKSEFALNDWILLHLKQLTETSSEQLADFCFSANISRDDYSWRIATVVKDIKHLQSFLNESLEQKHWHRIDKANVAPVFLFAGQGSIQTGAGLALYQRQPIFKASLQACDDALEKHQHVKATEILYGQQSEMLLEQTQHEQVALFSLQYALAKMWLSWGVKPAMLLGHSVGEYAAACIAGVFDLNEAIGMLCYRASLMQALPENGAMVAVLANQGQIEPLLQGMDAQLSIAAVNGEQQVVISGDAEVVDNFIQQAQKQGLHTRLLKVNRGFHSVQIDPVLSDFKTRLTQISFNKPQLRFISTLTGKQEIEKLTEVNYWVQHARQSVLFHQALTSAKELGGNFFIELGARPILTALAQQSSDTAFCSLDSNKNDWHACQQVVAALSKAGYQLDWPGFYQGRRRRLMSLPNYPWQRQSYWFSSTPTKARISPASGIHPMLQQAVNTPLWSGCLYQGNISCQQLPFLLDHQVFNQVVVAGACHLSALVAIGKELFNSKPFNIENIEFIEALQLNEHDNRLLQVGLTPLVDNQYQLQVISLVQQQSTAYSEHMQARLSVDSAQVSEPLYELLTLKQHCSKTIRIQDFYQILTRQHVQLGAGFCWFNQLFKGKNQALAQIRALTETEKPFGIPPGLIDACFQLLGAAVPEQYTETYIPIAVHHMHFAAERQLTNLWCYASLDGNEDGHQGLVSGKVALFNDQGQAIIELSGITLRKAEQSSMQQALMLDNNIYSVDWENIGAPDKIEIEPMTNHWLVVGQTFAKKIAKTADWAQWISLDDFIMCDCRQVEGVMFCLDSSQPHLDLVEQAQQTIENVVRCLQKVIACTEQTSLQLSVISQQSRLVIKQDSIDPTIELIAGLLRSFNHEHLFSHCQWLDVEQADISVSKIIQILKVNSTETELCLRSGDLFSPRLQATKLLTQQSQSSLKGAYLLTGGSGALALKTAYWLAEKGINKLILVSRKGLSEAHQQQIVALKKQGIEAHEVTADITDATQVEKVFKQYGHELRGIIHAAGVLNDNTIANIDQQQLQQVLKPKVLGLWNLHQFSKNLALDNFIAYSSVAALLGSPGQGSYAAANSFMDALMHWRHRQGLPGLSINWGPWAGQGMAAIQQDSQLALSGITKLTATQALFFLDLACAKPQNQSFQQLGFFNADWQQFKFNRSSLTKSLQANRQSEQPLLSERLSELPIKQRRRFLHNYLIDQIASVLGLTDSGRLATDIGFSEMGMDSIMMLDLKNRLQKAVNMQLPSTLAYKYPTVDELLAFLSTELFAEYFTEQSTHALVKEEQEEDIALLLEQELLQLESGQIND